MKIINGVVKIGYTWQKPATVDIYLSRLQQFFYLQIGTLVIYADWGTYE